MTVKFNRWLTNAVTSFALCAISAASVQATVVQFQTSLGEIEVNLYDDTTPETVANFLAYVAAGAYESSIIHRSVPGFVLQGGGFALSDDNTLGPVATPWSPINEPVYANVRGTIAMAKRGGDANSATSQWFINLGDNTANLDHQNGGFTVFGQVIGDGMAVVDAISDLTVSNKSALFANELWRGALGDVPVRASATDADFLAALADYFVMVNQITVIDASVDSAVDLDRPLRTPAPSAPVQRKKKGGSTDLLWLVWLSGLILLRGRPGLRKSA